MVFLIAVSYCSVAMDLFSKVRGWVSGVSRDFGLATVQSVIEIAGECLCGMGPYADGNPESALEAVCDGIGEGVISTQPLACTVSAPQEEGLQKHQVCEGQHSQVPLCSSAAVCLLAARVGACMMKETGASLNGGRAVTYYRNVVVSRWSLSGVGHCDSRIQNRGGRNGYGGPAAPGGGWPPDPCFEQ